MVSTRNDARQEWRRLTIVCTGRQGGPAWPTNTRVPRRLRRGTRYRKVTAHHAAAVTPDREAQAGSSTTGLGQPSSLTNRAGAPGERGHHLVGEQPQRAH